ncbi:MAG: hypothetical protein ACREOL_09965 [Candidatus Dormibacteria bacterium]
MGGLGSGQWSRWPKRATTAELPCLSIFRWDHRAYGPGRFGMDITYTRPHFGGQRPWWVCPGCASRRAKLYQDGHQVRCRVCLGLAHESQREDAWHRAVTRARAIRLRLGGSASLLEPFPAKPRGMRWDTYDRLLAEALRADRQVAGLGTTKSQWLLNTLERRIRAAETASKGR